MKFQDKQVFKISTDVLFQEVSGEIVLLDLAGERYFGLDPVGARIWTLLGEGASVEGIVERLEQEYEVERPVLQTDVADLLTELAEAGLIDAGPD